MTLLIWTTHRMKFFKLHRHFFNSLGCFLLSLIRSDSLIFNCLMLDYWNRKCVKFHIAWYYIERTRSPWYCKMKKKNRNPCNELMVSITHISWGDPPFCNYWNDRAKSALCWCQSLYVLNERNEIKRQFQAQMWSGYRGENRMNSNVPLSDFIRFHVYCS